MKSYITSAAYSLVQFPIRWEFPARGISWFRMELEPLRLVQYCYISRAGVAEAKCILVTHVCVSACMSVCLSVVRRMPTLLYTDPNVTWGNDRTAL